jgi:maltose alpha-D-glucosyltransferase/alpha-amylase
MYTDTYWYKDAVFYELYVRAFFDSNGDGHGDLKGVIEKLAYIKDLGVDCIWLLPTYPSPLKDDGYDISDYYDVHADYGTLDDFKALVDAIHKSGMRIIIDLVLNHTSDQHPWFQIARADRNSPFRDFYVWSDSDQKYSLARVIFNDTLDSNWTWDKEAGQFYWHRFYSEQPDLNYDNPAVQAEMFKIIDFWLNLGVDGFRADAVPYLFEREGTNCDNLPETHAYLKVLRSYMDEKYPGKILLLEANQWPEEVREYFADGDEAHMSFHFPVMPRIFMALKKADRTPLVNILERTPAIPENCQWCTFLRNHDELTLEMVTEEERQWMWDQYAPEQRMRLNLGIRRRLAPLLDNDRQKIELANAILFSLPGAPTLYYGDEIGMGDNIWLNDRDGVRTPMQWNSGANAGFSEARPHQLYAPVIDADIYGPSRVNVLAQQSDTDSLFHSIRKMVAIRKQHPVFGRGGFSWAASGLENLSIAGYWRNFQDEEILVICNLSAQEQKLPMADLDLQDDIVFRDLLSFRQRVHASDVLTLPPYKFLWLMREQA